MADWGFATWDANGVDNNTGIVRILVKGIIRLEDGQSSGGYSFTVEPGYTMDFLVQYAATGFSTGRRKITISGNNINVSSVSNNDYSPGTLMNCAANIIVFLR